MNSFAAGSQPERTAVPGPARDTLSGQQFARAADRIVATVEAVIDGKRDQVETALIVILAEGNLLIEDVPGVGKTMLARALAASIDCTVSRIQFTPDMLPADITGVSVWNQPTGEFEFKPGPVFANIVIGDEINRASPKTQSALLECMEERQVTADGATYPLASPFAVIATQNPIEMEGTYALPEAQRDRFMARMSMGYPSAASEVAMLRQHRDPNPLAGLEPVVSIADLLTMIETVRHVFVSVAVERYAVAIAQATRQHRALRVGASPRATLQLVRAAKARAALDGRDFVLPDDIDDLVVTVLEHRIVSRSGVRHGDVGVLAEVIEQIVADTPVPIGAAGR